MLEEYGRRERYSIWMILCAVDSHAGSGLCQTSVLNKLSLRVQSEGRSGHQLMKCTRDDLEVVLSSSVEAENLHFWLKFVSSV